MKTEIDSKTITRAAETGGKPETAGDATEIACKPKTAATKIVGKTKTAGASGERSLTKNGGLTTESVGKTKKAALNPVAALALCALLWSFGGLVIKLIKWDALAIAGIRSLLGMITVTIAFRRLPKIFVRRDENSLQDQNSGDENCRQDQKAGGNQNCVQDQKSRPKKIDWSATVNLLLGGILYAATMLLFVPATKMTTAANAILLQYTNPIYIIAFGPLLTGEICGGQRTPGLPIR